MNAFDEPKRKRMPGQEYTITVRIFATTGAFPSTGEAGKFYFAGTVSDYENDLNDLYVWNPSTSQYQTYAGPRPHKPPPNP